MCPELEEGSPGQKGEKSASVSVADNRCEGVFTAGLEESDVASPSGWRVGVASSEAGNTLAVESEMGVAVGTVGVAHRTD